MALPTDFLRLYEELGLPSDASLDALKQAYRRRVSELHPDRLHENDPVSARRSAERLQRLTAMYAAATTFHRRHGRLPGASVPPNRTRTRTPIPLRASAPPTRRRSRKIVWIALIAATAAWLLLRPSTQEDMPTETAGGADHEAIAPHLPQMPSPVHALKTGMTSDDVLALEGAPVTRGGDRWSYGPSWIAFDDDKVTDWYSSPLRPLKSTRARPTPR